MSELINYFNGDDLATSVWQGKYQYEGEITPDDMHKRLAKSFASVEKEYVKEELSLITEKILRQLSYYGRERDELTEEKIFNYFKNFKYIIPQGSVMAQLGVDSIGSLSNCFVVGQPIDSYGGIFQKDQEMAQLMKRRGGVGIDIATLRPAGAPTSNAAKTSTGATSFMHRFSNTTREVAQNGRRGAAMISTDINHPDVLDFIKAKRDLTQVTGANISVKLNNEFMQAVVNDEDYVLRWPCDKDFDSISYNTYNFNYDVLESWNGFYTKKIKAKEYWNEIIKSAHNVAEPGLMFWNAMVDYSPDGIYDKFRQITTNPCSEIAMQPYDACRLIAVNFFNFVKKPFTKDAYFDFDEFYKVNYEAMRLSDDLIDLEIQHIDRILGKIASDPERWELKQPEYSLWIKVKETALASRRTGLGFTALGDTLAALGFKYDSKDALSIIKEIMHVKMQSELDCTIDLAILRGTFKGWDAKTEFHEEHTPETILVGNNSFYDFIATEFLASAKRMIKYGRRNVSWSTVAPTGTLSLLAQTTSGIEPLFQPYYTRRKKVNPNDSDVRIDFTDENGDNWQEFPVLHPKFKDWININFDKLGLSRQEDIEIELSKEDLQQCFKKSPWYGSTANDIDWIKRVEIQATIQKYITHSISSTINLPNDVSEEEVSKIYLESWKQGLKGITVYRDGSRSGVLVTKKEDKFDYRNGFKRPKEIPGESHTTSIKGVKYTVAVGLVDNKPYEVFAFKGEGYSGKGKIIKQKRGHYIFQNGKSYDITDNLDELEEAITRGYSWGLRHGGDVKFAVEQLQKTKGDLFSFTSALARILKKYIPDGAKSTVTCNDCGSSNVIFEEGCHKCLDCGSSKCG